MFERMKDHLPPRPFDPTRDAALDRLEAFVPRAGRTYAAERNHDLDGHPHVSGLSLWLRHRALTEAEVAAAVLDRHAPSTAGKFLSEILWRTYFKGWLERRPGIWSGYLDGLSAARDRLATEAGLRVRWEEACEGRTGIAPFDHWVRELVETGYLHNHARMWFASIWMHTLRLPWELGADFFLRHLLDGDPASNTLSWRWVGGRHTIGRSYLARPGNIVRYSAGRWDAEELRGQLASDADLDAEEHPAHPQPGPMPEDADWDSDRLTGLLLTEDDLHPDFLLARGLRPATAAILIAPAGRSPLAVSANVTSFTQRLAEDAAARLSAIFPCAAPTDDPVAIVRWAMAAELEQIVVPYTPVGPARTALDRVEAALTIPVIRPLRAWDATAWPHATAGFFKVKARTADILEAIPQDLGP